MGNELPAKANYSNSTFFSLIETIFFLFFRFCFSILFFFCLIFFFFVSQIDEDSI